MEDDDTELRLDEEDVKTCTSVDTEKQELRNEEDVSFSDLEDEDNDFSGKICGFRLAQDNRDSSPSGSNDEWVRLNKNAGSQDFVISWVSSHFIDDPVIHH
ncbi:hypothetical protein F0562_030191 [Nyssa sinensis]|uniref:Uncharacterized protein n=1 Tax=Nyssa sinensis TaxID=561372 RepID=A0A5J5AY41_9ASTE|nr:hypothetical protein F0562_030191 [Nyssa sinensis]